MKKQSLIRFFFSFANTVSTLLCVVFYICAKTNSLIHEPKAPDDLERFKAVK